MPEPYFHFLADDIFFGSYAHLGKCGQVLETNMQFSTKSFFSKTAADTQLTEA